MQDDARLETLRQALHDLTLAERERSRTWAWSASGLLAPAERRNAQREAEREVKIARERLRKARDALAPTEIEERAWGAH